MFAPFPVLTVTIEQRGNGDDIHVHAGGQGFWIARMLATLEVSATVCGAFGGETGTVIRTLIEQQDIRVRAVEAETPNPAYVHDRRGGERKVVSETPVLPLSRHDVDELYGAALVEGLDASITVIGGAQPKVLPDETFRRLTRDLRANGGLVVADLSGGQLRAALAGGVDARWSGSSPTGGPTVRPNRRCPRGTTCAAGKARGRRSAQHRALVLDDDDRAGGGPDVRAPTTGACGD